MIVCFRLDIRVLVGSLVTESNQKRIQEKEQIFGFSKKKRDTQRRRQNEREGERER